MQYDKYCSLLFLHRNNNILLAMKKRGFGANRYNGVGGKIEPGETIKQALVRECQEEINVTPTLFEKVAEHDFHMDADTDNPWHMYVHAYIATEWEGEPEETEEMAPQWFAIDTIPYENMWQDDKYWLPAVLAGKRIVGEYTFLANESLSEYTIREVDVLPNLIPFKAT